MRKTLLVASLLGLAAPAHADTAHADSGPPADVMALAPVPYGQLTEAAKPTAYRLDLTIDPAKERFSGHVEIDATLAASSRFVDLHGRNLAMHRVLARVGRKYVTGSWSQLEETGVARLTFPEALPAGPVTLLFDYDAPFNDSPSGLFRVKVGDAWYGWSQFESIDARAAFPGFDQPGFKVPFIVTLRTPKGLTAVSNAPETKVTREQGLVVHRFAPTLPLPTYLVAMMVGPFAVEKGAVPPDPQRTKPLPLRIVSPKPNGDRLRFALDGTKGIVQHLEAYFGEPFPFPKLDQITSPIMGGAMENAGADNYEDGLIVMREDAPVTQKRAFGMVVAHELAHQWFGDMVTPAWWDDIWLNESFANWMGYRIGNEWRPDLNIGAGATAEGFAAMGTDALLAGRPIHQKIDRNGQIDAAFDSITYGKGGHVVAMIAAYMGDTKFRDGVRRYMAAHRYGNATSADFFRAMAEVSGDPRLLPAMQSFTDQQGVPLVTFSGGVNGRYTVAQSRYARLGTVPPKAHWGIPLCLRRGAERDCTLLTDDSATIELGGSGVLMPNAGGTGYYRFELPKPEWDALIATADTLPGGEAQAVADSLRASFQAGRASAAQLAALAEKLARNPDSQASGIALQSLEGLSDSGFFETAAAAAYRRFVARIYAPLLAKSGFDPRAGAYTGQDPDTIQNRAQVVRTMADTARDSALRQRLAEAAAAWIGGDHKALDPAWYGLALGIWTEANGPAGAQRLFGLALASEDPLFRPNALAAIGGSDKPDIARWVLDSGRDPKLRPSERLMLIAGVLGNPATADIGYDWTKAHLEELISGAGGIFFTSRLPQILSAFCSVARAEDFARDLGPRFAGKPGELELARTIERVRDCGILKTARAKETSADLAK